MASESAERLMESGKAQNAITQDGETLIKNQVSGEWETYHGQQLQEPGDDYKGGE